MKPALEFWPALWTALLATLFAAQLVVGLAARSLMHWLIAREYPEDAAVDRKAEEAAGPWLPIWVGVVETTTFFLFFVFEVAAAGAFIGAWLIVKMGTGWHRLALATQSRYYPRMGFAALTLTLLNVLFALVGAQVFYWLLGG